MRSKLPQISKLKWGTLNFLASIFIDRKNANYKVIWFLNYYYIYNKFIVIGKEKQADMDRDQLCTSKLRTIHYVQEN